MTTTATATDCDDRRFLRRLRAEIDARLFEASKAAEAVPGSEWRELCNLPGLSFGYVGNCGAGFDDRSFAIWTESRETEGMYAGNKLTLWHGSDLNRREFSRARVVVGAYRLGLEHASRSSANL